MILGVLGVCLISACPVVNSAGEPLQKMGSAKACYLFFELFDASYFQSSDKDMQCVELDYLREFSQQQLTEATEKIYQKLHGKSQVKLDELNLHQLYQAYEPVTEQDRLRFCVSSEKGGSLYRNGALLQHFVNIGFAHRLMRVWVLGTTGTGEPDWNFRQCG